MGKPNRKNNETVKYALCTLLVVFLLSGAFLLLNMWENGKFGSFAQSPGAEQVGLETRLEFEGQEYELKDNIETFLVLGLDKFSGSPSNDDSYNNDKQSDLLMLMIFDNSEKTCSAIQINRDTIANVNILGVAGDKIDTVKQQIALAHTYGNGKEVSCRNTADSVSDLLNGIKIDHYISVTMDAIPIINDLVGGVEVTVLEDFAGIDDTLIKGETVTLKGEQALTYVRARMGMADASNVSRMERQQQYFYALQDAAEKSIAQDEEFIAKSAVKISDYMVSDRTVNQLQELADKFSEYEFSGIENIVGESVVGEEYMEFHPDEYAKEEMIVKLFYQLA